MNNYSSIFENNKITDFFENWCDQIDENDTIVDKNCGQEIIDNEYYPSDFNSINDFHQHILMKIYKPNSFVKKYLSENIFLNKISELKYIAVHIRWSDKINGSAKETEYIPLDKYLNLCIDIRNKSNINNIVVCSDTNEGIHELIRINNENKYNFNIIYDSDEDRLPNSPEKSFVQNIYNIDRERQKLEYLYAFKNTSTLLNFYAIVANFDSCFVLISVQLRNNKNDMNVTNKTPIWGYAINNES